MSFGDAHEYMISGANFRVSGVIYDNTNNLINNLTGLVAQVSIDGNSFINTLNNPVAIGSGFFYLDLKGNETNGKTILIKVSCSNANAVVSSSVFYPRKLSPILSGSILLGSINTVTLPANAIKKDGQFQGCFMLVTNNIPAGSQFQVRRIINTNAATQIVVIDSNWSVIPSNLTTYDILVAETVGIGAWNGKSIATSNIDGYPAVDIAQILGNPVTTGSVPDVNVKTWANTNVTNSPISGLPDVNTKTILDNATATSSLAANANNLTNLDASVAAVKTQTDTLPSVAGTMSAFNMNLAVLNGNVGAIRVDTDMIPDINNEINDINNKTSTVLSQINSIPDAMVSLENAISGIAAETNVLPNISSSLTTIENTVNSIKNQTDKLSFNGNTVLSDIRNIGGSASSIPKLGSYFNAMVSGQLSGSIRTTSSFSTNFTSTKDNLYIGRKIIFLSGNLQYCMATISSYNGNNKSITVSTSLPAVPDANSLILVV